MAVFRTGMMAQRGLIFSRGVETSEGGGAVNDVRELSKGFPQP